VFNVQTGRWITKVDLAKPGSAPNEKILAIWKPCGGDNESNSQKLLAVTDKHLISVQIPQGRIVSKVAHQNNFKIPKERWDVQVVVDSGGQLDRIYYVQREADHSFSLHSVSMTGGTTGNKKRPVRFGQVQTTPQALYGANHGLVVKVGFVTQGQAQTKLSFLTQDGYTVDENRTLPKSRPLTCLVVHQREPVVATGDKSGRIAVWRRDINNKFVPTYLKHWHSLPVHTLAWSPGSGGTRHLYSGGEEGVILKWDAREGRHIGMVPRLGSTIVNITATEEAVAVATEHNTLKMFTANLQELVTDSDKAGNRHKSRNFAGISGLCADPKKRLFWHAETRCLAALSTKKRQIQIYDPVRRSQMVALDVSSVNAILGERENKVTMEDIDFCASGCGRWLATVEHNWDTLGGNCLKIWKFSPAHSAQFELNTRINQPHTVPPHNLNFVTLPPDGAPGLVTCGNTKAKLWRVRAGEGRWEPVSSFMHLGKSPKAVAQSEDLSILAVTFGSSLTLWNSQSCAMIASLSLKDICNTTSYDSVAFGRGDSCHLIFGTQSKKDIEGKVSSSEVVVWNTITCRMVYRLPLHEGGSTTTSSFLPRPVNGKLCLLHPKGITTIGQDLGLKNILESEEAVDTAVADADHTRIYILSGGKLGYLNLDSEAIDNFVGTEEVSGESTALEHALGNRLDAQLQQDIFYARVNANFMKPEAVTSHLSSVSAMLLKKSLPT